MLSEPDAEEVLFHSPPRANTLHSRLSGKVVDAYESNHSSRRGTSFYREKLEGQSCAIPLHAHFAVLLCTVPSVIFVGSRANPRQTPRISAPAGTSRDHGGPLFIAAGTIKRGVRIGIDRALENIGEIKISD